MTSASLLILESGLQTTVQDLGRPGLMRYGVAPGGALDRSALILGNRLLANDAGAAALEITLIGPRLRFSGAAVVALTGADLGAFLAGSPLPRWQPVAVADGDELTFQPPTGTGGARAYLCVAGGLAIPPVMASRTTDLFGGFGGWHGRALRPGDDLPLGDPTESPDIILRRRLAFPPPEHAPNDPVRVVLGPQTDRFTADGLATFLAAPYAVSPRADRMGLRLSGPPIRHGRGADLISEGIAHGAIQVPGDGQPIVLLAARQTVGGYPKIATVIGADLDLLGQRRPGDPIRFAAVEPAAARALTLADHARLGTDAVTTIPTLAAGWTATDPAPLRQTEQGGASMANAWDPAAVARLVAALHDADVISFRLELAAAGLKLELNRGSDALVAPAPGTDPEPDSDPSADLVPAPLLGVFYRRPAPDQPPLVEPGQPVVAGQPLGLLEVMKTYHEVTAPRAGILAAFLVKDGQFVEFGQPIARLVPPS